MKPALLKFAAKLQLALAVAMSTGCVSTQPFFLNESPDLQYYLNSATRVEYPDVDVEPLPDTVGTIAPLSLGNHEYEFWDLSVEECVSIAIQNSKVFSTTGGNAEFRQNVSAQLVSSNVEQVGTIYDVAVQQATTQSIPLTVDSTGSRTLPRGVVRANQVGGVEDALAEFDAQVSGFLRYSQTDRPRNIGDSTVSVTFAQADDITQQSAISKRFATGGVATVRQQTIYNSSNLPAIADNLATSSARLVDSDWTFLVEAQIQHPLMRNRGTLVNRIPVVLASLNEDLAITDFEIQ
ncbi:MAG: transporter, partial [Planctomycetota bacterium]